MKISICFLFLFLTFPAFSQTSALRAGNKAYDEGKYGAAFDYYEKATKGGKVQAGVYNSGAALYKLNDFEGAAKAFSTSSDAGQKLSQDSLFNAGDAYYQAGQKEEAKASFRKAILQNPKDEQAIYNLQFILKQEQTEQKENEQKNSNQDKKQQDENKDKEQNQDSQNNSQNNSQQNQQDKQQQDKQDSMAKEEGANILQMAQEHQQNFQNPPQGSKPRVEKDW